MADGRVVELAEYVVLDLQLVTAAGMVSLSSARCPIVDSADRELLLGNDEIKPLGIDVKRMIEQLAASGRLQDEEDEFPVGGELVAGGGGAKTCREQRRRLGRRCSRRHD